MLIACFKNNAASRSDWRHLPVSTKGGNPPFNQAPLSFKARRAWRIGPEGKPKDQAITRPLLQGTAGMRSRTRSGSLTQARTRQTTKTRAHLQANFTEDVTPAANVPPSPPLPITTLMGPLGRPIDMYIYTRGHIEGYVS